MIVTRPCLPDPPDLLVRETLVFSNATAARTGVKPGRVVNLDRTEHTDFDCLQIEPWPPDAPQTQFPPAKQCTNTMLKFSTHPPLISRVLY